MPAAHVSSVAVINELTATNQHTYTSEIEDDWYKRRTEKEREQVRDRQREREREKRKTTKEKGKKLYINRSRGEGRE